MNTPVKLKFTVDTSILKTFVKELKTKKNPKGIYYFRIKSDRKEWPHEPIRFILERVTKRLHEIKVEIK